MKLCVVSEVGNPPHTACCNFNGLMPPYSAFGGIARISQRAILDLRDPTGDIFASDTPLVALSFITGPLVAALISRCWTFSLRGRIPNLFRDVSCFLLLLLYLFFCGHRLVLRLSAIFLV